MGYQKKVKKAKELYKKFHGENGKNKVKTIDLGDITVLTELSNRVVSIAYEACKIHLGDNKIETYEHEFEKQCFLYTNKERNILIIAGKSINVDEKGIHG